MCSYWRNNSKFTLQDLAVAAVAGYLFNPNSNFEEDFEGRPGGQFWRGALIFAFGERDGLWNRFGSDVGIEPLIVLHNSKTKTGRYKVNSMVHKLYNSINQDNPLQEP